MNKKLYIRFFINDKAGVPTDSLFVCDGNELSPVSHWIVKYAENVAEWMMLYPCGKVDFVWL